MTIAKKVSIAAGACFIGFLIVTYVRSLPPPPDVFIVEDPPWTIWEYSALALFMCGLGLTIAAIKLRR
jgi:hypothetical protein